jgi:hypothetical protein
MSASAASDRHCLLPSNQRGFLRAPFPGDDDDFEPPEPPRGDWRTKLDAAKDVFQIGLGLIAFAFVMLVVGRLIGMFFFFEALGLTP